MVRLVSFGAFLAFGLFCTGLFATLYAQDPENSGTSAGIRLYSYRMDPAERSDVKRYDVQPPSWKTFEDKTQFIALRSFPSKDGVGLDFGTTIDRFQKEDLGRVIWPHAGTIYFKNLNELADVIRERNLYLFDFWGYVPGSGPRESGDWTQFRADPAQFRLLEEKLGDRWLGMDNGEQDGRYVGGYAPFHATGDDSRFEQYLCFQRHFERLSEDLGNRLATLVSLNFGHYFVKEGSYTLIGAETAQALPNAQIYYSWIRGAGKQYGVLWFGNASIFNRWGWKVYPDKPTDGSSLALLKRLMYAQILYNSAAVGFENGWFVGDNLSPIGKIQQSAKRWLDENGDPGVHAAPVAFLNDFFCGWSFPRHLYTGKSYLVWGNTPYSAGDYLTNDLFDLAYPGYQDSSYFHDERGFMSPTPYGDCVDSLLTDAPLELLKQYASIFIADEIHADVELRDKLTAYVENGGRVILTADAIKKFGSFLNISLASNELCSLDGGTVSWHDGAPIEETSPFEYYTLALPRDAKTVAACGDAVLAAEVPYGKGAAVVIASPFGLSSRRAFSGVIENKTDAPLANPYPLLNFARKVFEEELDRNVLFDVGSDLASIVCRKRENVYTVGIFNNGLSELPFKIESRIGAIQSIRELKTDESERAAVGFLPKGFENAEVGRNTEQTVAGGAVRIFEVTLTDETVTPIAKTAWPERPQGRWLAIREADQLTTPIKESILARPTFFQHWDGVVVDWKYLNIRSVEQIQKEARWLKRQKLNIVVDLTSGIDLFPDLRLILNDPEEYNSSVNVVRSVIEKASVLGAREIILRTHRTPENNYSSEATHADVVKTLREICDFAKQKDVRVSLRISGQNGASLGAPGTTLVSAGALLDEIAKDNLYVAPTFAALQGAVKDGDLWQRVKPRLSFALAAGWLEDENNGGIWSDSALLTALPEERFREIKDFLGPDVPVVFYAFYKNRNEEYLDVKRWETE